MEVEDMELYVDVVIMAVWAKIVMLYISRSCRPK